MTEKNMWNLSPQEALKACQASEQGLTTEQAEKIRLEKGENVLLEEKKKSAFQVFLDQFKDLMVVILIGAAIISMFSGNEESTIVIFAVLVMNAVLGTVQHMFTDDGPAQFIRAIKAKYPEQLVMADCDNFENAMLCAEAGADFVGTTMRGYTPETTGIDDIDFDFIRKLSAECPAKIIAEGHIHYPEQAVKALEAGAFALVVGGAITRPAEITARFTGAINAAKK